MFNIAIQFYPLLWFEKRGFVQNNLNGKCSTVYIELFINSVDSSTNISDRNGLCNGTELVSARENSYTHFPLEDCTHLYYFKISYFIGQGALHNEHCSSMNCHNDLCNIGNTLE